ncbi:uncharacterized protein LOC124129708 [Haliotis rufescens]|uniref:uncharacterized protein LOC124129708 n=1 Tax=Haliotis rufescens TaxID=6454 RepID=UPI001EB007C6|nr:uncharacterized protein LOC124129708 [Haliotis rufescens]
MADLETVKREFEAVLHHVTDDVRSHFLSWIKDKINSGEWGDVTREKSNEDVMLETIQSHLRAELPINAVSSTESFHFPQTGPNADCDPSTTVHVDAFLYDEDAVDELCEEGKMSRNYCTGCGSKDVQPLTFITHSASASQVKYIFSYALPDLSGKTVLDVGSRTGALLYGAYLYSKAKHIVGVELDSTFTSLQTAAVSKYKMGDRIQVIHDDIQNKGTLIASSDVVILNNVFEFFVPKDLQEKLWSYLFSTLRNNTILVTVPSLEESLQQLQTGINLKQCVESIDLTSALQKGRHQLLDSPGADDADLTSIHLYRVLG